MKLFAGLSRTDYEDVFRAVGALVDERGWSNVSLMEVDDGLVVQVMTRPSLRETKPRLETYLLTDNDLERVLRDAVQRRRRKQQSREPEVERAPLPPPAPPLAPPLPPPAYAAAPPPAPSRPAPSRIIEERLASLVAQGNRPLPMAPAGDTDGPLPPLPALHGLPTERPLGITDPFDVAPATPAPPPAPFPPPPEEEEPLFAPEPMRLSGVPAPPAFDAGAARAAVVMAHIVAARLKSGMPMTGDDPDLASLLEQVRALDEAGIGKG